MSAPIIFPDIEQLLCDELPGLMATQGISSLNVSSRVPKVRPAEFVRVMRTGGSQRDKVTDLPTVVVEAWAATESRANRIAQTVRGVLHELTELDGVPVYEVREFAGPANLPDPATAAVRYTATYQIAVRGSTA